MATEANVDNHLADIYWALLDPEQPSSRGWVLSVFHLWKPWIMSVGCYHLPIDPPHCTLYYDRNEDALYAEDFQSINGDKWTLKSSFIYIAQTGVAALCDLTGEQLQWYKMSDTAMPHISLALGHAHEARELEPMVKKLHSLEDWQNSNISDVQY